MEATQLLDLYPDIFCVGILSSCTICQGMLFDTYAVHDGVNIINVFGNKNGKKFLEK